jgi:uncharacterized protein YndB with AHSA1/START domain
MSTVDVVVEVDIAAAPADVAAVMFDPEREPEWMKAVTGVEIIDPALAPGARVRRRGSFLGRAIAWTTEVEAVQFPHRLALRIIDGPFVGTVRYEIERAETGSLVRIRNVGQPSKLGFFPAGLLAAPMRAALTADLRRLKAIVEEATAP